MSDDRDDRIGIALLKDERMLLVGVHEKYILNAAKRDVTARISLKTIEEECGIKRNQFDTISLTTLENFDRFKLADENGADNIKAAIHGLFDQMFDHMKKRFREEQKKEEEPKKPDNILKWRRKD